MKPSVFVIIFFIVIIGISSCKKGSGTTPATGVDIYLAGGLPGANGTTFTAAYWKNGTVVIINKSVPSYANAIAINGNDVYVAGSTITSAGEVATLWKNGKPQYLTDSTINSNALAITIQGNNIYVAGTVGQNATYWTNGSPTTIALNNGEKNSISSAIAVVGNDVYVAGNVLPSAGGGIAVYWKNGVETQLTAPPVYAVTSAITLQGSNVYVAGTKYGVLSNTPVYWKNGQQVLMNDNISATASGIAIEGSNVYLTGVAAPSNAYGNSVPSEYTNIFMLWKNGTMLNPNYLRGAQSTGNMVIADTDVYVAGTYSPGVGYYKNGVPIQVTSSTSSALNITVVKH